MFVKDICSILTVWIQILASPLTKCGPLCKHVISHLQNRLHEEFIHWYIMRKVFLSTYWAPGTPVGTVDCVRVLSSSVASDSATLWTVACQTLSVGFSGQEYWTEWWTNWSKVCPQRAYVPARAAPSYNRYCLGSVLQGQLAQELWGWCLGRKPCW